MIDGKGGSTGSKAGPVNLIENPGGKDKGKASNAEVDKAMESRTQKAASKDPELNTDSMPSGGPKPALPDVPSTRSGECSVTATNSRKPFKLGG